ncbi:MAG TPA: SDR family NAD(P)-dependent oxidoreductase [Acidimicrobiales bacterium]|nr:SDR family NAD(P)-dependent oxidoreductase [Acidimicrobiales bacterium]
MSDRLCEGRVCIVTGGGRGIGRQHCLELARQGARVVVVDPGVGIDGGTTSEDPADAVVREIHENGGEAVADQGSVADWTACARMVRDTVDRYGRLDAVVNNAGILRDRMITSMSEDDFDAVISVHLKGTFQMTRHACDHWRSVAKSGGDSRGRIVNTTSGAGLKGNIGQANYAAAKAGIAALTLVTAMEMARYDVTCNAVSPVALTRMSATISADTGPNVSDDGYDPLHPRTTSGLVAYLASGASGWLTGQVLRVEGDTVIRMAGWEQTAHRYTSRSGGYLEADELVTGMRQAYGAFPTGLFSALK